MDEEGYFYFIGRKDDIVQTGGRKVSHREVRNALHGMIEIDETVVMGCQILGSGSPSKPSYGYTVEL